MQAQDEPVAAATRLGSGSFATVFVLRGGRLAHKVVTHHDRSKELRSEYDALEVIYQKCNSDSFFCVPRAIAFYDPATKVLISNLPSPGNIGRIRSIRPVLTPVDFAPFTSHNAVYSMDRVEAIPTRIADRIKTMFYPPAFSTMASPSLCRLYFGKDEAASRFLNSANFPIYHSRYESLRKELPSLDT